MKSIWKYPICTADQVIISMQKNAEILDVQIQNGQPCIWAVVDDHEIPEFRQFVIHGTGHPMYLDNVSYIGTYQEPSGLVFHLFEVINEGM